MIYTNLKLIYLNIFAGMTCVVDKYSLDELNEEIPAPDLYEEFRKPCIEV